MIAGFISLTERFFRVCLPADNPKSQKIGLNGDDAIEVAALSGRDAAELGRPTHRLATAWNQMES
jgi:hypothetical protein